MVDVHIDGIAFQILRVAIDTVAELFCAENRLRVLQQRTQQGKLATGQARYYLDQAEARAELEGQGLAGEALAALLIGDLWRWGMRRDNAEESDLERSWRQTARWLVSDVPSRVMVMATSGWTPTTTVVAPRRRATWASARSVWQANESITSRAAMSCRDSSSGTAWLEPRTLAVGLMILCFAVAEGSPRAVLRTVVREPGTVAVVPAATLGQHFQDDVGLAVPARADRDGNRCFAPAMASQWPRSDHLTWPAGSFVPPDGGRGTRYSCTSAYPPMFTRRMYQVFT